jgi:hypothetical protein
MHEGIIAVENYWMYRDIFFNEFAGLTKINFVHLAL